MTQTPSLSNPRIGTTTPRTCLVCPVICNPSQTRPRSTLRYAYVYGPGTPPTSQSPQSLYLCVKSRRVSYSSAISGIGSYALVFVCYLIQLTVSYWI